jgi:hypothetical protein
MQNGSVQTEHAGQPVLPAPESLKFYRWAVKLLNRARIPYLVGGAYAFARFTGITRHTKDFDIFIRPADCERVLGLFAEQGCQTDLTFPHWLGKVLCGDDFIDVIFSSGNGAAPVDDDWFEHAIDGKVFGLSVRLCPPEEMIWQKSLIMERERFDGADVAHILHARGADLDWPRLLRRFDDKWRVLLAHLVLFGFIYPGERDKIPASVQRELIGRLEQELRSEPVSEQLCQGTLLSREQYLVDVARWGYQDARLAPNGNLSKEDVAHWTAGIQNDG